MKKHIVFLLIIIPRFINLMIAILIHKSFAVLDEKDQQWLIKELTAFDRMIWR